MTDKDEIQAFIKQNTQVGKAYLIAENAVRSYEPGEILAVRFVKRIYINDTSVLCYIVKYADKTTEAVPVIEDGQKIIDEYQRNYFCVDCGKDIMKNLYYDEYEVQDELWRKHGVKQKRLCVHCFQLRVGRPLLLEDFKADSEINIANRFIKKISNRIEFKIEGIQRK